MNNKFYLDKDTISNFYSEEESSEENKNKYNYINMLKY